MKSDTHKSGISIVIPTLNEEGNIKALVKRLHVALNKAHLEYELVFIDDNSTDGTFSIIESLASKYPINLALKKGARGKSSSLIQGFKVASYDILAMIDADLQYPPEAIVDMVQKIGEGADIVIANRKIRETNYFRKFLSTGFNFVFGKLIHGLSCDVQSGLKVFRKQILQEINLAPTPWTIDLELLVGARNAGFKIDTVEIVFNERTAGESKINFIKAVLEIGGHALKYRFKQKIPAAIAASNTGSMIGAGFAHKRQRFITHTSLSHHVSALNTFLPWQKLFIFVCLSGFILGFVFFPLKTAIIFTSVLSLIYFTDVIFNFYLVTKSLSSPPEFRFRDSELTALDDSELPIYTILCPLFREAHVLPGFVHAIENLDWPKDKLDVILLLEESDYETIAAASALNLPQEYRIIAVPHSMPQTKPKACNYGLNLARGEYLVVYDAEDIPEIVQLKKSYLAFQKVDSSVICLQAKLNYFNPRHNFLTRFFTAEYSLWFDVILPGLQSINSYIPLGGTSNHFRTKSLLDLKGWDPFNVTEDCDLGARLFKSGYRTAIIDSTTLEEANSNVFNWLRQRSRWIKGYMQTYLVHMRRPIIFFKESGVHAVIFQLVVGGKIAFLLINPFLWLMTIAYFALRTTAGPTIEALYPPVIFYIAVISLLVGNFLYLYYYMIGCAKREHWSLIKYIYLVPVYWLMTSIAGVIALYQLIVKPHYWEKTNHGLNMKPEVLPSDDFELTPTSAHAPKIGWFNSGLVSQSTIFLGVLMFSNFINFIFNAYLGRVLSFEEFGLVTLVNTILSLFSILYSGLGSTINYRTAYLAASDNTDLANSFFKYVFRRSLILSLAASALWLTLTPVLSKFFQIQDLAVLLLFTPVLTFGVIGAANKGFLQGNLKFTWVAVVYVAESLSKFILALLFIRFGIKSFVYLAIPLSIVSSAIVSVVLRGKLFKPAIPKIANTFPTSFFLSAILATVSSTVFLSLDIILVKHYLDPVIAGQYVLLSLVGKMIFFFGSLPMALMITLVSRNEALKEDTKRIFRILLGVTAALVFVGFVFLGPLGGIVIPILLGSKTLVILPFVNQYVIAISLFTLANVIVSYHLAKRNYAFPIASILVSGFMGIGIIVSHADLSNVVDIIYWAGVFAMALMSAMHFFEEEFAYLSKRLTEFFQKKEPIDFEGQRILIFNWRDTKHVFAGGAEVYIQELAKKWVLQGNKVTIFCGNDKKSAHKEVIDGVEIIRRGGFYLVYAWAIIYYFAKFRGRFDVIIDCQNGIPFFTPLYVTEPVFCLMHHVHQEVFTRSLVKPLAVLARFLENGLMPLVYKNIRFITISYSSKFAIEQLGLGRAGIDIVHPGLSLNITAAIKKSSAPTILYLGRLKAYKSIDVLIKAFAIVVEKEPESRLIIAGSGEEESNLRRLARELNLGKKVVFAGRVSEQNKVKLLQKAWVFVNPSFMEGWGITTVEANACGTPIVASDVPGLRDSVQDPRTGYLVSHGDYPTFAEKILEIILDKELRQNMGREAKVWASNFDWQKNSIQFLSIIRAENEFAPKYYEVDEA